MLALVLSQLDCGGASGATKVEAAGNDVMLIADAPPRDDPAEPSPMPAADTDPPMANASEQHPSGHADLDPTNDHIVGPPEPMSNCEALLEAAGVRFSAARIGLGRKRDGVYTCGSAQVVRYRRGPGEIAYDKAPLLTCKMALALADFETIAQEEAQRAFGRRIRRIDHLGTYNCRKMAAYDLVSEHSFANGIDLRRFHLDGGETIGVLEHFRPDDLEPDDPRTIFLRRLSNRLFDEGIFSVVVTPFFDRFHRNHIHVDLARYRVDGSRP